jgi:hypothetical protein
VSRRSGGNAIKDSLSGIVWFLHRFVLQPREARGLQVRRSPAAPAQGCSKTGSVACRPLLAQPKTPRHSGPRRGSPRPHRIRSRGSSERVSLSCKLKKQRGTGCSSVVKVGAHRISQSAAA